MGNSEKSRGENKKMFIKIGGGGGGGIGAVVLLGGALATAALASFFAVRRNPKIHKDQTDIIREEDDGMGTTKINYAQSLKLDDKAMVETSADDIDGFVIILDEKNKHDYSHEYEYEYEYDTNECNIGNGEMKGKGDLSGDEAIAVSENTPLLPIFEEGQQGDDAELMDEAIQEEYTEEKTGEESESSESESDSDAGIVHKQNLDARKQDHVILAAGEAGAGLEVCENNMISMQVEAGKNIELIKKTAGPQEANLASVRRDDSSNWEALWQAELPQLIKYEVGGKIQQDKYAVELGRVKDYPTNSMRWRMMVWTISVLSSLSCSWFFNLSVPKLCLVLFLTAFLLEIYGYSLLNRQHAHCLVAAEEDHKKPSCNKLANLS